MDGDFSKYLIVNQKFKDFEELAQVTKFWGNELYLESFFDMGVGISSIQKIDYTFIEKMNLSFNFAVGVDDSYENYGFKVTYRF